jgi:hypothetical protein
MRYSEIAFAHTPTVERGWGKLRQAAAYLSPSDDLDILKARLTQEWKP